MIKINIAKSKKCNGDYSLYITFDFDMRIVNVIREFPSKYWNADDKIWELPFNKLGEFVSKVDWCEIDISADEYLTLEKPKAVTPIDFKFKTQPYEHQIVGFNFGLNNDRWLLGDEMGLGKTKQVIDIAVAKKLQKNYKHCLIICGVNGLKWNWQNEVKIHSDESAYILGQRIVKDRIVIGSTADKLTDVKKLSTNPAYFIITNIETLREESIVTELKKLCDSKEIGIIAFDECHKAKNPLSQQGKGILKLSADTMIAMTGTPLMNNPFDLYIILKWLGYEKHAFGAFKHHYADYGGYGGYEVIGYKNLDELQERLDEIMLRRRKEEVLDLPEKTYVDEYVEMSASQKKIYNEVTADIKMNIDQIKMANNPLAELIRMRQATGYTGILSSTVKESAKLDRMEELVEEAVSNGKKVVIFSNWTQITDEVFHRLCKKYTPAVITGETKDEDRQKMVGYFQNNDDCQIIIGTSGAMGTGLTLTAGTVEIFLDEPWNMALKEQCVDRCHRIGQKNNITVYTLMCENSIDQRIHELVEKKGAMADALVDGKLNKENAKEVLDFLLS
jgi:SNF2 family DNA or RNA helicase